MARGPNRRAERMSHDRELHWSVKRWLRAAGKWKILCECHQWSSVKVFRDKVRRLIHRAQGLHSNCEERVCHGEFCVLFALPDSSQFSDFASFSKCGRDVWLCQSAHNCDVPGQQLSRAPRYLRHSVWAFAISSWNADWFFGRWDARQHQSSHNRVIKLLMSGYSAQGMFADEAMLTVNINQHSAAASVRGLKVQTKTKCHSHTNHLIIQPEPTWCYGKRQQPVSAMRSWSHQKLCSLISIWLWLLH